MTDKEVRIKILKILQNFNNNDPYNFLDKEKLKERFEEEIEENVLDRNVKYLRDKGFIKTHLFLGGGFMAQITADGIDYLEIVEENENNN